MAKIEKVKKEYLWKETKRTFLGMPLSFTRYRLDEEKLYIQTGFFNTTEDEVRLYRITDVTLKRSFGQKMLGLGTIHCDSSDVTMKNFDIKNIPQAREVKELMSRLVDASRLRNRVFTHESVTNAPHDHEEAGAYPPADNADVDLDHDGIPDAQE